MHKSIYNNIEYFTSIGKLITIIYFYLLLFQIFDVTDLINLYNHINKKTVKIFW